jgi:lipopolysaccharide export system permease protein
MMGIIDRMLLREIFKTLLVVVVVIAVLLLSNLLVRYLGKAAAGALNTDVLLMVVGLELVRALGLIIPPAFFFSVLWVLGRMYRDSEMVALAASGFGYSRIFRSVLLAALPLAALVLLLVMELLPWAKGYVSQLRAMEASTADISGLKPGRFNEFSRGGLVVFTERRAEDGSELGGVFVQDRQHGKLGLVTAETAYQRTDPDTGERFIILTEGRRYEGTPGQLDYLVGRFDEYAVRIPTAETDSAQISESSKPWQELIASDDPEDHAEFHYRLSVPLALLAFGILAVPLARSPPRSGVYGRLIFAVLVYFTFMNMQHVAENWLEDGVLPGWLGMWWLPLLMVLFAGLLIVVDSNWFVMQFRRWRVGHQ